MSQITPLTISEDRDVRESQEVSIARTLICNYENFLIALMVYQNIPQASIEEKTEYAKRWKGDMEELRKFVVISAFPPAYDPVWLESLQAIGSTTIVAL